MTQPRRPRRAAVLSAALRSWAATTADHGDQATLVELRQAPDWEYVGKTPLTDGQVARLLEVLRADLVPAAPLTPEQASAAVDQLLAEWRAEGRTRIRPDDLADAMPRIGRSREWLAAHLTHLADQGYIGETRRPGTYRI